MYEGELMGNTIGLTIKDIITKENIHLFIDLKNMPK
jgi:hypothetical protein